MSERVFGFLIVSFGMQEEQIPAFIIQNIDNNVSAICIPLKGLNKGRIIFYPN